MSLLFLILLASFIMFFTSEQPAALGGSLILMSFLSALSFSFMFSSWYGLMLFLIYVGGLLVLFMYVIMLSSNFILSFSLKTTIKGFFVLMFMWALKNFNLPSKILAESMSSCSSSLMMGLFLSLGVFLLLVFFSIVHMVLFKGVILKLNE
uniref:NADH dehydrogenase subunit 6 n=1 Tax=Pupilla muscorum TaxID=225749 RepID=A0A0A6ZAD8_9EUPU|nr:NADH dehydrogenase subunit 6 [Pupilla muscorum]AGC52864.1 NADH dehydrogenase subunit 6 [Pupilla muscorum]